MLLITNTSDRIKLLAKNKNITLKAMLSECKLGINTISKISQGTDISSGNLAKIADYFDVSVDYLLCRTDIPQINRPDGSPHQNKLTIEELSLISQYRKKPEMHESIHKLLDMPYNDK